jgi:hypothetical protein
LLRFAAAVTAFHQENQMRDRISLAAGTIALVCFASFAFAQNPPAAPKPGPEVKKLGALIGKWKETGELKASAMGPGGKYSGTNSCEWTAGGFGVLCHETGEIPGMFNSVTTALIAYDDGAKKYTYSVVDSTGMSAVSHGTVDGDTWTWVSDSMMNGQNFHQRYTMKFTSKDAYDFAYEMGADEKSMQQIMTGADKRSTPSAAKPAKK